jgi:hypothetical protein
MKLIRLQVHRLGMAAVLFCAAAAITSTAQTIVTFDAPGAGTGKTQGTAAGTINTAGEITGYYLDSGSVFHGYLRTP